MRVSAKEQRSHWPGRQRVQHHNDEATRPLGGGSGDYRLSGFRLFCLGRLEQRPGEDACGIVRVGSWIKAFIRLFSRASMWRAGGLHLRLAWARAIYGRGRSAAVSDACQRRPACHRGHRGRRRRTELAGAPTRTPAARTISNRAAGRGPPADHDGGNRWFQSMRRTPRIVTADRGDPAPAIAGLFSPTLYLNNSAPNPSLRTKRKKSTGFGSRRQGDKRAMDVSAPLCPRRSGLAIYRKREPVQ
jgi:hypothetical protein